MSTTLKPIRAGDLRYRVEIQSPSVAVAADGEQSETFATDATRSMAIRQLSGEEGFREDQVRSTATHEFTFRYYAGLTTKHRFVFDSRNFGIVSISNDQEINHRMTVQCREEVTPS